MSERLFPSIKKYSTLEAGMTSSPFPLLCIISVVRKLHVRMISTILLWLGLLQGHPSPPLPEQELNTWLLSHDQGLLLLSELQSQNQ